MAIWSAAGILLIGLMRRQPIRRTRAIDRAAAAATSTFYTIPTDPTPPPQRTADPEVNL